MLRQFSLFALVALCVSSVSAETIVSDNLGNLIGLPIAGGNATGTITNTNSRVSTSPYKLNVYINNGAAGSGGLPNTDETFWLMPPSNPPLYGNATLVRTGYSANFDEATLVWNTTAGQYLGSPLAPNENIGLYQYYFTIPVLSSVLVNLTYINAGAPNPVVDQISILVTNPSVAVGDPQFVGLRGQSFQVHGIDGAVYNIITEKNTQVNARFVFLSEGECPMVNGRLDSNCWSHPGSYMGEMSFQQVVDGKLHKALLVAGPAATGYDLIELDGKKLSVGDDISFGSFRINVRSTHVVSVETESFSFELSNSDKFINQAVNNLKPLSKLTSHGLLGQTHVAKVYSGATRYIEGEVDDYVISDNSIWGSDFGYNKFQPL